MIQSIESIALIFVTAAIVSFIVASLVLPRAQVPAPTSPIYYYTNGTHKYYLINVRILDVNKKPYVACTAGIVFTYRYVNDDRMYLNHTTAEVVNGTARLEFKDITSRPVINAAVSGIPDMVNSTVNAAISVDFYYDPSVIADAAPVKLYITYCLGSEKRVVEILFNDVLTAPVR